MSSHQLIYTKIFKVLCSDLPNGFVYNNESYEQSKYKNNRCGLQVDDRNQG